MFFSLKPGPSSSIINCASFFLISQIIDILLFDGLKEIALSKRFATICSSLLSTPKTFSLDPFRLELFISILIFVFEFYKLLLKSSTTESITFDKSIFVIFALDKAASSFNI